MIDVSIQLPTTDRVAWKHQLAHPIATNSTHSVRRQRSSRVIRTCTCCVLSGSGARVHIGPQSQCHSIFISCAFFVRTYAYSRRRCQKPTNVNAKLDHAFHGSTMMPVSLYSQKSIADVLYENIFLCTTPFNFRLHFVMYSMQDTEYISRLFLDTRADTRKDTAMPYVPYDAWIRWACDTHTRCTSKYLHDITLGCMTQMYLFLKEYRAVLGATGCVRPAIRAANIMYAQPKIGECGLRIARGAPSVRPSARGRAADARGACAAFVTYLDCIRDAYTAARRRPPRVLARARAAVHGAGVAADIDVVLQSLQQCVRHQRYTHLMKNEF